MRAFHARLSLVLGRGWNKKVIKQRFAVPVGDADGHCFCVQINAAIIRMLLRSWKRRCVGGKIKLAFIYSFNRFQYGIKTM